MELARQERTATSLVQKHKSSVIFEPPGNMLAEAPEGEAQKKSCVGPSTVAGDWVGAKPRLLVHPCRRSQLRGPGMPEWIGRQEVVGLFECGGE